MEESEFVLDNIEKLSHKKIKGLNLLYRASENNGCANIFHEKCDGKIPTLTIIIWRIYRKKLVFPYY